MVKFPWKNNHKGCSDEDEILLGESSKKVITKGFQCSKQIKNKILFQILINKIFNLVFIKQSIYLPVIYWW